MSKKKQKKWLWIKLAGVTTIIGGIAIFGWFWLKEIPDPRKLETNEYPEASQIFDRNGKLLYEFYSEKRRLSAKLDEVPKTLVEATIAVEDRTFYRHWGFDLKGMARGLYRTVLKKRLQGGSTITQQLVKNALLTPERTWERKIKEAFLTVLTEIRYSKEQILEMYFNQTPYGGTIWGVKAAAKGIFGKELKDLTLAQAALIAGLPGSPTKYSPFTNPTAAKSRQELVLTRMEEEGYISKEEREKAAKEELVYNLNRGNLLAPHFVFYTKDKLIQKYGEKLVNEGGLRITTSLDWKVQEAAEAAIKKELEKLKKSQVTNGAVLITEPKTGAILAMVGSKDYFATDIDGKFNVVTALRQPGSAIKPINYAVGIETGKITAATVFDDNPTCFRSEGQKLYCPTNYGGRYFGLQTMRNALGNSLNIPATKVLKINGLETLVASASAMGLKTLEDASDYGLSLTLGGGEVTMEDMAVAFGVFANMGLKQGLSPIRRIENSQGKVLEEHTYIPGLRVLSRETAFIIQQILSDDGARGMVFGRGSLLTIKNHPEVAVKTGTTNDLRDNWTIGYTPDYVVVTWVGNNNNTKMGRLVSGTTGAAPVWHEVMTGLMEGKTVKKPAIPNNIIGMYVCNQTGELVPEEGCESHYEYFKNDFVPTKRVAVKMNILIDKDTGKPVQEGENKPNVEWQEHQAVKDATGVVVCFDCQVTSEEEKKKAIIISGD